MTRIKEVIESAGGQQVWVKAIHRDGNVASHQADHTVDVLARSPAFDAVLSAIAREAEKQGLESGIKKIRLQDGQRSVEIRFLRQHELISRWQLREVRQLCRVAVIIDDLGQDLSAARELLQLPYPLTFSVLPHLRHSVEIAEEAHGAGREVMLHLPMEREPGAAVAPGPGAIRVGMSSDEVVHIIRRDLASVPYSVGVNNHMGSRATADAPLMAAVMKVLAEDRLYFVDSRTTAASVALDLARRQRIPAFYRSVFLDDTETVAYSLGKLREFRRLAEEQGAAVAIGHPYPTTLAALAEFFPELEQNDIQLVPTSQLVRLPEVARLSPPRPPTLPRMR